MRLDPPLDLTPPPVDGGLTDRAAAALLTAVLATAAELVTLFRAVLTDGFDRGWGFDGRLLPLLAAVGMVAAALVAVVDGVRGGERGRALGSVLAVVAVPFALAGLAALYVVVAAC